MLHSWSICDSHRFASHVLCLQFEIGILSMLHVGIEILPGLTKACKQNNLHLVFVSMKCDPLQMPIKHL